MCNKGGRNGKEGPAGKGKAKATVEPNPSVSSMVRAVLYRHWNTLLRKRTWVFRTVIQKTNSWVHTAHGHLRTATWRYNLQGHFPFSGNSMYSTSSLRNGDSREKRAHFRQNCIHITSINYKFQSVSCSRGTPSVTRIHPHFIRSPNDSNVSKFPQQTAQVLSPDSKKLPVRPLFLSFH